jgi:regulator of sirC expression with transglutaminase-like and TPR domain
MMTGAVRDRLAEALREGDLPSVCLLLAAARHPNISLDRYHAHINRLAEETGRHFHAGGDLSPEAQLASLKFAIEGGHGYHVDPAPEHVLETADLIRVIDRRVACPLALSMLCLFVAEAQGWDASILDFAGAYALRLEHGARRFICDPAEGWAELQAKDLRRRVKDRQGEHAELSATYYEPVPDEDVPLALENLIKIRLIEDSEYEAAYRLVTLLRFVRPGEHRLLLDEGVLAARTLRYAESAKALEAYIDAAPRETDRREAAVLLQNVRSHL